MTLLSINPVTESRRRKKGQQRVAAPEPAKEAPADQTNQLRDRYERNRIQNTPTATVSRFYRLGLFNSLRWRIFVFSIHGQQPNTLG